MRSFQIRCLTLASCYYSWLNTQLFRAIQMVQRAMPWRQCQILIFLANFLGILSTKKGLFLVEAIIVTSPVQTPHNSCMMKVVHYHVPWAWMQFQNSFLIDSLVWGRHKKTKTNTKNKKTKHTHTHTQLKYGGWCNMCPSCINRNLVLEKPRESGFLAEVCWIPYLRPIEPIVAREATLSFVYHLSHAKIHVDHWISTKFCGIVEKVVTFNPSLLVQVPTKCSQFIIEEHDFLLLSSLS